MFISLTDLNVARFRKQSWPNSVFTVEASYQEANASCKLMRKRASHVDKPAVMNRSFWGIVFPISSRSLRGQAITHAQKESTAYKQVRLPPAGDLHIYSSLKYKGPV